MKRFFILFLLVGCGSESVQPTNFSDRNSIPFQITTEPADKVSNGLDFAYEIAKEKFADEVPMPKIVFIYSTLEELLDKCDQTGNIGGCMWGKDVALIFKSSDIVLCSNMLHELGHLYFEKTEGEPDHNHDKHPEFFSWARFACEKPMYLARRGNNV